MRIVVFVILLVSWGGGVGCATARPVPTARLGLLDRLSHLEEDYSHLADDSTVGRVRNLASLWSWPLKNVEVTSPFGKRGNEFHEGIDLRASVGTSVYAVESGTVLYAGNKIKGYGHLIVLKHPSGLATIYAHNSKVYVRRGQRVRCGQKIASSGRSGKVTGAHLHFEVREGTLALDPMRILPDTKTASHSQKIKVSFLSAE